MGFFYIIGRYPQIKKTAKKCGKNACIFSALMIFYQSCGMIAVKREVATKKFGRFSVERMSILKNGDKSLYQVNSCSG